MRSSVLHFCLGSIAPLTLGLTVAAAADSTAASTSRSSSSATRPVAGRSAPGKGPLPDPTLLDGSSQPAEKKSENGMIGEFELPGDENARSGKVGGPSGQGQNPGGTPPVGIQVSLPSLPIGGVSAQSGQQQGGGLPGVGIQTPGAAPAAGGQAGIGLQIPDASSKPVGAGGDPGGQQQGIQVAELGGDASGQSAGGGPAGEKPKQVAIGDSTMRIEPTANAPGVVGGQQQVAGKTQQSEKGTGSGGKGTGGTGGPNRVEKGRAIPSGL
jgi:hypothetical protein